MVDPSDEKRMEIAKSMTGIDGLDQITGRGLPKRVATLVAGNVGCGMTLFAMATTGKPGGEDRG